jgi:hypothetical protein
VSLFLEAGVNSVKNSLYIMETQHYELTKQYYMVKGEGVKKSKKDTLPRNGIC